MAEPIKPRYTKEDREWAMGLGQDLVSNLNKESLGDDKEKKSWLKSAWDFLYGEDAKSLGKGMGIFLSFIAITIGGYIFLFIFLMGMGIISSLFGFSLDSEDTPDCLYEYSPYGGDAC